MAEDGREVLRCSTCGRWWPIEEEGRAKSHVGTHSGKGFSTAELTVVPIRDVDQGDQTDWYEWEAKEPPEGSEA